MRNIHDWCISRQLWWGHRIPAWHCKDCREIIVAREAPTTCAKCGGKPSRTGHRCARHLVLIGTAAVFRRSAGPITRADLDAFYPTSLLITGFDILFFWVARMIMLDCHFMRGHQGRRRAVPHGLYPCAGARRRAPEDVEDQGQRRRSHRDHRAVRHRRGAVHAGLDGRAGHATSPFPRTRPTAIAPSPTRFGMLRACCS